MRTLETDTVTLQREAHAMGENASIRDQNALQRKLNLVSALSFEIRVFRQILMYLSLTS